MVKREPHSGYVPQPGSFLYSTFAVVSTRRLPPRGDRPHQNRGHTFPLDGRASVVNLKGPTVFLAPLRPRTAQRGRCFAEFEGTHDPVHSAASHGARHYQVAPRGRSAGRPRGAQASRRAVLRHAGRGGGGDPRRGARAGPDNGSGCAAARPVPRDPDDPRAHPRREPPPASVPCPGAERAGARSRCLAHPGRSEEHTSELQSRPHLVCRLLLEKKKTKVL